MCCYEFRLALSSSDGESGPRTTVLKSFSIWRRTWNWGDRSLLVVWFRWPDAKRKLPNRKWICPYSASFTGERMPINMEEPYRWVGGNLDMFGWINVRLGSSFLVLIECLFWSACFSISFSWGLPWLFSFHCIDFALHIAAWQCNVM